MAKTLRLADDLALPIEAVTEKLAFLGRTGTGKTYAAMKLAELMLEAGAQIVALDFVGKWYGLRVPGLGDPFPIPVFGGLHGDYPLESTGGRLVADLIVDRNISAVLDVSQFTRGEQIRFALDFGTQFFQRKKALPSAVHLFLEECQEVLPQNPQPNEGQMLGAFERIWKLGRNFGIGGSLISQRPQEVNKKALNMSGTLFVFQMTGPQERKTIESWVTAQDINEDIAEVLPTLTKGRPHVWSVAFEKPISKTVQVSQKRTADVSATLLVDPGKRKEKPLTPIDAEELTAAMAATIERAKADDPKELRKLLAQASRDATASASRVKELEARLERTSGSSHSNEGKKQEVPVLTDADRQLLLNLNNALNARLSDLTHNLQLDIGRVITAVSDMCRGFEKDLHETQSGQRDEFLKRLEGARLLKVLDKVERASVAEAGNKITARDTRPLAQRPAQPNPNNTPIRQPGSGEALPPGERAVLTAAAMWSGGVTRDQLGVLTGYKRSSRDAYVARLAVKGFIEVAGGQVLATEGGVHALGADFEPLPTGAALLDWWRAKLPKGERDVLEVLVNHNGRPVARQTIDEATGFKRSSRDAYLARLSSRRLVESVGRGEVRASEELFS